MVGSGGPLRLRRRVPITRKRYEDLRPGRELEWERCCLRRHLRDRRINCFPSQGTVTINLYFPSSAWQPANKSDLRNVSAFHAAASLRGRVWPRPRVYTISHLGSGRRRRRRGRHRPGCTDLLRAADVFEEQLCQVAQSLVRGLGKPQHAVDHGRGRNV